MCSLEISSTVLTAEDCNYSLWEDVITIWLFSKIYPGMVCHHLHLKCHWHLGAWSGMTKGIISLVVFHQINWLYCSFLFSYPDILPVHTKCMLRAVSTAKGQRADPVLCITNPYHQFKQANEQHQLKERTEVVGLSGFFSSPFILWWKNQRNALLTDVPERGRKLLKGLFGEKIVSPGRLLCYYGKNCHPELLPPEPGGN